jgi:hypothetical protein
MEERYHVPILGTRRKILIATDVNAGEKAGTLLPVDRRKGLAG